MPRRPYQHFCGLAAAMDVLGDRWAPLVIRELLPGPQRFTDLERGLPGVSPDMLSARLRDLADAGVVERKNLEPPASTTVYRLTESGRALEPAILALARWGMARLGDPRYADAEFEPRWLWMGMRALFTPDQAPSQPIRFRLDAGEPVQAEVGPDGLRRLDDDEDVDVTITVAKDDVVAFIRGEAGRPEIDGDPDLAFAALGSFRT
jgi:DNA-binding HxlR family transcriptional regulator